MDDLDPSIRNAMEGLERPAKISTEPTSREEPAALFFVIFGLVYETLANPYSEPSTTSRESVSALVLKAMRSLVRPEYAGNALFDPPILEELLGLWYRMAMTETPTVQAQLIDVIVAFSTGTREFPDEYVCITQGSGLIFDLLE